MCLMSQVIDSGATVPVRQWTPDAYQQFQQILDAVRALDAKLGQPDCDDPAKQAWMRDIEARLARLEAAGQ